MVYENIKKQIKIFTALRFSVLVSIYLFLNFRTLLLIRNSASWVINSFVVNALFLYPLKASENLTIF